MLSYLVPPLLPSSVTSLFSPPLDAANLNVSLLTGRLQLNHLALNASHLNSHLLPALCPVHLRRGTIADVSVEVDWKRLFSQPLLVRAAGVHLVLTHNTFGTAAANHPHGEEQHAKVHTTSDDASAIYTGAGKDTYEERKEVLSGASHPPDAARTHDHESILLDAAISSKLAALDLSHPNALNFTPLPWPDISALSIQSTTKRLVAAVMRALHVEASDIRIEFEDEPTAATTPTVAGPQTKEDAESETIDAAEVDTTDEEKLPESESVESVQATLKSLGLASSAADAEQAAHAHIGIEIKACKLESFKSSAEELGVSGSILA